MKIKERKLLGGIAFFLSLTLVSISFWPEYIFAQSKIDTTATIDSTRELNNTVPRHPQNLYFFHSYTCPHCRSEKPVLEKIADELPELNLYEFELSDNEGLLVYTSIGELLNAETSSIPFTVLGGKYFVGWMDSYEDTVREEINNCIINNCEDPVKKILPENADNFLYKPKEVFIGPVPEQPAESETGNKNISNTKDSKNTDNNIVQEKATAQPSTGLFDSSKKETLNLPLFGEINLKTVSLPMLTFLVALVDGFNPCAMWVLLFLIFLLLNIEDTKRRWVLGLTFILTSGAVYYAFLAAWLNFFLFVGMITVIRMVIGLFSITFGMKSLKSYYTDKDPGCIAEKTENRSKIFSKLRALVAEEHILPAVMGITGLAIAVNIVELICSLGFPAIYTQTLSLSNLPAYKYYLYLLFYIVVFMLDDAIVFVAAMLTLKMVGVQKKYLRVVRLVGGILMILLGMLLIFRPELLSFGV